MNFTFVSGATSGIGKATAYKLAKTGHALIINGRRKDRLKEMQRELSAFTPVEVAAFDLANPQEVDHWFEENKNLCNQVKVLINNAGLARGVDPIQVGQLSDWNEMIDVNVKGLLHLSRKMIGSVIAHRGHIVNVGSVAGRWTYPGGAVYSATKFAVRALSEGMRLDLLGTGVRVTNIEPGMVETEFSEVRLKDPEAAKAIYKNMKPLSADDIAETIQWALARPAHVNIQELVIFPTDQASVRDVYRGGGKP